jgi:DNA-binding XRE family transcriptional regulator
MASFTRLSERPPNVPRKYTAAIAMRIIKRIEIFKCCDVFDSCIKVPFKFNSFPLVEQYLTIVKYLSRIFFCHVSDVANISDYEALRSEIIRLLRQERVRQKLSKYAVAQRSGVSESMLSLVERGLRNPTLELVLRMADGIGADLPAIIRKARASKRRDK